MYAMVCGFCSLSCRSSTELTDLFEEDCYEGEAWNQPVADLQQKIAAQLESYLSNESLAEDTFLLKHVQRNKMGYVSLKLLTSFKKVCIFQQFIVEFHCHHPIDMSDFDVYN